MFANLFRQMPALWWGVLLFISAILGWVLTALHLPAAVLLGCMLAGIWLSSHEVRLGIPGILFALAQGVLGCLMAQSLQPATLVKVAGSWPIFLGATVSILAASAGLGWLLMRRQVFPGTTAVWGLAPGAASAMVLMAEAYGADVRLVAFMQYLRVAVVTAVAALVAGLWTHHAAAAPAAVPWFSVINPVHVGLTLLLAVAGSTVARWLHIPGGAMVIPLLLGAALQAMGWLVIELPAALLAVSYALIGWSIGLRFTRAILRHAFRALPAVLGSIFALMAVGLVIAVALNQWAGYDPLTAYLASSPGGADSVAIIAATSAVDAGFVMAMQLARFLMVLVWGPQVSKFIATRSRAK
ncbi:MAG: AbrB family transcriptional regulator [Rhodoferax sp.]|uniref:AbrB family transcriptional regulator n=1 Tax=Rhodoferax sp. TaxID=50421 RepID=UPI002630CAD0|nr:AbrB family transcriptional regulator [Rhodoferax sp.]MDD2878878.1 AbrB family transcriptional regulator [Rhodoferax sp.]